MMIFARCKDHYGRILFMVCCLGDDESVIRTAVQCERYAPVGSSCGGAGGRVYPVVIEFELSGNCLVCRYLDLCHFHVLCKLRAVIRRKDEVGCFVREREGVAPVTQSAGFRRAAVSVCTDVRGIVRSAL